MNENWCALCLAILKPISPEDAFDVVWGEMRNRRGLSIELKRTSDEEIVRLKKANFTWNEISMKLNLTVAQARNRYRRYMEGKMIRKPEGSVTKENIKEMVALKVDHTYQEIADIFGVRADTVYRKIRDYRNSIEGGEIIAGCKRKKPLVTRQLTNS